MDTSKVMKRERYWNVRKNKVKKRQRYWIVGRVIMRLNEKQLKDVDCSMYEV